MGEMRLLLQVKKGENSVLSLFVFDEESFDEVLGVIGHAVPDVVIKVIVCIVHQRECLTLVFTSKRGVTTQPATISYTAIQCSTVQHNAKQ